jgi:hypothetical protein
VNTVTLIFGKGVTAGGNMTSARLTVEPVFNGTNAVVWDGDGTPMLPFTENASADEGSYGSTQLPVVDQTGWLDDGQHAFTMWGYKLTETPMYGRTAGKPRIKYWQPVTGQTNVDFDRIPDGSLGLPVSGPLAGVTSVNGQVGAVTISSGTSDYNALTNKPDIAGQIAAAVNALKGGAAGAFDTLKELETALGDDANFAATVTAALNARPTTASLAATFLQYATDPDDGSLILKVGV